jgi:hypothetical protein
LLPTGERTREDPSLSDPAQRLASFGQEDHVRIYGGDLTERLREAGLAASPACFGDLFDARECARFGLDADELLIICRPRTS